MTTHKITWLRTGHQNGMDWESEHEITFRFRPAERPIIYGDAPHPGSDAEIEVVSIKPDAGDHGAFSDLAQQGLESDAQDWLDDEGYSAALEVVAADNEAAREFADELRRDR